MILTLLQFAVLMYTLKLDFIMLKKILIFRRILWGNPLNLCDLTDF